MKAAINSATWGGYAGFKGVKADWRQFVREAAEAGYSGVELGGDESTLGPPAECRAFVEKQGLEVVSLGLNVTYNPWAPNTAQYRRTIDYAKRLGVSTLMCCGGFMPSPRRNTYAFDYDMFAGNLGKAIAYAGRRGLTVAFHNHRGCVVETIREMSEMTKRLKDLRICVDIAHLEASGEDALKFIREFGDRIVTTHIKDFSWKKNSFVELGKGDGKLDVAACVRALKKSGYDGWLVVELDKKFTDKDRTPLESARLCRAYLKRQCAV